MAGVSSPSTVYVLQGDSEGRGRLLKLSLQSQKLEVVATGVGDVSLIAARTGGFFVLGKSSLHRVDLDGAVQKLVQGAEQSDWSAVGELDDGSLVVLDRRSDWVLRISSSGSISKRSQIPMARKPSLVTDLIRVGEKFCLIRLGDDEGLLFYELDCTGSLRKIRLSGAIRSPGKPAYVARENVHAELAFGPGPLLFDQDGGFYFVDIETTRTLYHLSKSGMAQKILKLDAIQPWLSRMILDRDSSRLLVPSAACLFAIDLRQAQKPDQPLYYNLALEGARQWMLDPWKDKPSPGTHTARQQTVARAIENTRKAEIDDSAQELEAMQQILATTCTGWRSTGRSGGGS